MALVTTAVLIAALPTAARANTYHHYSLNAYGISGSDGWSATSDDQGRGYVGSSLAPSGATGTFNIGGGRGTVYAPENVAFQYNAPADTSLIYVGWTSTVDRIAGGDWNTLARDATQHFYTDVPSHIGANGLVAAVSGSWMRFTFQCGGPNPCYASNDASFNVRHADVTLDDPYGPNAGAAQGDLVTDSRLKGAMPVSFAATDAGSGLYRTLIYVDGSLKTSTVVDRNGGHCTDVNGNRAYDRRVPCLLSATATASLNTAALSDGTHSIHVRVEDAAGNATTVWGPFNRLVANDPPVNTAAPKFQNNTGAATPHVGDALAMLDKGSWSGANLTYVTGWEQCDAAGAFCSQIPGATGLSYTPGADDVGKRLRYAVTATNVAGAITVFSSLSGVVKTQESSTTPPTSKPSNPTATNPGDAGGGSGDSGSGGWSRGPSIALPGLPAPAISKTVEHVFVGRIVGEPAGATCPGDKASLVFEHVRGGQKKLGYGKASTAQLQLTCTTNGKAIAGAQLQIATRTGAQAAVASDVTTDGAGHAVLRLAQGASRGITVGYRMYADEPLARAIATLKVLVNSKLWLKTDRKSMRNGQAVTLRGKLAGGLIPKRGVNLTVQWKDGGRWRPFAQIKATTKGTFKYAYKFTQTSRRVTYRLRVQVAKGQVDYPFLATVSRSVRVTVAP